MTLARLRRTTGSTSFGDHRSTITDAGGHTIAVVEDRNLLDLLSGWEPQDACRGIEPPAALAVNSGWIELEAEPAGDDGPPVNPLMWTGAGRARTDEALSRLLAAVPPEIEVWVRPAAGHVVSDAPGCLLLASASHEAAARGEPAPRLLLDPAAMLTGEMRQAAADHIARILAAAAGHERTAAVVVDIAPDDGHATSPGLTATAWAEVEALRPGWGAELLRSGRLVIGGAVTDEDAHRVLKLG